MKLTLLHGLMILLLILPISEARHESFSRTLDEDVDAWIVEVAEIKPSLIPAIALEHRSNAMVNVYLSFTPLSSLANLDYDIRSIRVTRVTRTEGVRSSFYHRLYNENEINELEAEKEEDKIATGIFGKLLGVKEAGVVGVGLDYYGSARPQEAKEVSDKDAASICASFGDNTTFEDKVPDSITLDLVADITFSAKENGDLVPASMFTAGTEYARYEFYIEEDLRAWESRNADLESKNPTEFNTRRKQEEARLNQHYYGKGAIMRDRVYFNVTIGVDKTRIYPSSPELLRKQICGTITLRENLAKIIKPINTINNYAQGVCLATFVTTTTGVLTGVIDNVCDAIDVRSLGCDWVMCPNNKCRNGINPMYSLVGSSVLCWDKDRPFFGKQLLPEQEWKRNEDYTYTNTPVDVPGEFMCRYSDGASRLNPVGTPTGKYVPLPHYACLTGIEGNLEIIDVFVQKYQDCLVAAKTQGLSVGLCDKLRSYFFCERTVGELLTLSQAGRLSDWVSDATLARAKEYTSVEDSVQKAEGNFKKNIEDVAILGKDTVESYKNVPFFALLTNQRQYETNAICNLYVSGKLFSLKDLKKMITAVVPDSYYVITEKKEWSYTSGNDPKPLSYSYDVFFSLYASEVDATRSDSYSVWLQGTAIDKDGNLKGVCRVDVDFGRVSAGKMVQKNAFKVKECDAQTQCIRFKGLTSCSQINQPLSSAGSYDPLGLSLLWQNPDDKDSDGLPDAWEELNSISEACRDEDGDGFSNAVEFLYGNNPRGDNNALNNVAKSESDSLKGSKGCDTAQTELKKRYGETKKSDEDIAREGRNVDDELETITFGGDPSKTCDEQNGFVCNQETDECKEALESDDVYPDSGEICCKAECLPKEENKINLISFKIDGEENDEINQGGKYTIELSFDKVVSSCKIKAKITEEKEYTLSLSSDKKTCAGDILLIGKSTPVLILAEPEGGGSYFYSEQKTIINNENSQTGNSLVCKIGTGSAYYYLIDDGQRCSDYTFKTMKDNPTTFGILDNDQQPNPIAAESYCTSHVSDPRFNLCDNIADEKELTLTQLV